MTQPKTLILLLLSFLLFMNGNAQEESKKKERDISFLPLPFISYNRTQKLQFGVLPLLMYPMNKRDSISPQSVAGSALVFTTNGSFYFFGFSKMYFAEDHWRLSAAIGTGDQNAQTYIEAIDIPEGLYEYATAFSVFHFELQRRISGAMFVGGSFTRTVATSELEDQPTTTTDNRNNGLSASLSTDTRNSVYYPKNGSLMNLKWISFPGWLYNDTRANKITVDYNRYIPFNNSADVLALRGSLKAGLGQIDFEQQQVIGKKDIRGYTQGEFRGDGKISLQGEYRKNYENRFGLVGFMGMATIYGSDNPDYSWKIYPGIGAGVRYTIFDKNHLNVGLDAAVGDGDWGLYFRIGEAF